MPVPGDAPVLLAIRSCPALRDHGNCDALLKAGLGRDALLSSMLDVSFSPVLLMGQTKKRIRKDNTGSIQAGIIPAASQDRKQFPKAQARFGLATGGVCACVYTGVSVLWGTCL